MSTEIEPTAESIRQRLTALQQELDELVAALPRHSVKPSQLIRIEELEDEISEQQAELRRLLDPPA